jgi:DNA-directed RNA polymerase subunit K/omega
MSTPPSQYKDDLQQITLVPEPESNTKASPINMDELLINVNKDSDEEEEYDSIDDDDDDGDDDDDDDDVDANSNSDGDNEVSGDDDDDDDDDGNSDDDDYDIRVPKLNNEDEIKDLLMRGGGDINLEVDDDSDGSYDTDDIEDDDSDYSDISDMNDEYFKKFEKTSKMDYIKRAHPEQISHNSDEVIKLSRITRINNCITDPFHRSIPILSKYEKTQILGQRSVQIENGATPFIHVPDNIINSHIIAEMELAQKKIPFIIRRPMNDGTCEYWKIADLEVL